MQLFKRRIYLLLLTCGVLQLPLLGATVLRQMNLEDMIQRADRIFRGTVLDFSAGTVAVGGVELPTVTYRLRVDEGFKGSYTIVKGDDQVVEIQMIGALKKAPATGDPIQALPVLPDLPRLKVGKDYLLFTTAPSSIGLSTTVGLGQGSFSIVSRNKQDLVINEFNNVGLFRDMEVEGFPSQGLVNYAQLGDLIRDLLSAE